ncbi:hypothetical protein Scep_002075 [Stephania cephalantha]|uniref:RNase H type-1 domain-containing protein n=1 Tax=Stephania cephalantha TaxID=152367 RepID=A0AAP0Q5N0_9MAGN
MIWKGGAALLSHGFLVESGVGRVLKEGGGSEPKRGETREEGGRRRGGRTVLTGREWASVCARRRRLSSLAGVRGGTWNVVLCGGPVVSESGGDGRRRRRRDTRGGGEEGSDAEEEEDVAYDMALNALPTAANLVKRRVVELGRCSISKFEEETLTHALFTCKIPTKLWAQSLFAKKISNILSTSIGTSFLECILNFPLTDMELAVRADTRECGIGGVIRDNLGSIHVAFAEYIEDHFSIELAETWAMKRGLELAQELDLEISGVESDAQGAEGGLKEKPRRELAREMRGRVGYVEDVGLSTGGGEGGEELMSNEQGTRRTATRGSKSSD